MEPDYEAVTEHEDEILAVDLKRDLLEFTYSDDQFVLQLIDLFINAQKIVLVNKTQQDELFEVTKRRDDYRRGYTAIRTAVNQFLSNGIPEFQRSDDAGIIGMKLANMVGAINALRIAFEKTEL